MTEGYRAVQLGTGNGYYVLIPAQGRFMWFQNKPSPERLYAELRKAEQREEDYKDLFPVEDLLELCRLKDSVGTVLVSGLYKGYSTKVTDGGSVYWVHPVFGVVSWMNATVAQEIINTLSLESFKLEDIDLDLQEVQSGDGNQQVGNVQA